MTPDLITRLEAPYSCPLTDMQAARLCPHLFHPECYANAPAEVRAMQHHSICRNRDCLALRALTPTEEGSEDHGV